MKQLLYILTIILPVFAHSQTDSKIITDSSIIETKYFKSFNYIGVFNELNDNSKTYFTQYYYDTKNLQELSTFGEDGNYIGISEFYSNNGNLISKIDFDNGIWIFVDKKEFPFFDLQNYMKLKADSLVSEMYGYDFLINHTVWSIGSSHIYNKNESSDWEDQLQDRPTRFLFRYHVKLDAKSLYKDLIEFELDSNGYFTPNQYESIFGFENVPDSLKGGFNLTLEDAINKAKQLGMTENDSTKAVGILRWENFKKPELINGQFRFYVTIQTKLIENIVPNGRSSRITKYEVYTFNPWTGAFVEKKKMKSIYSWESMSGHSTGLIPDNE